MLSPLQLTVVLVEVSLMHECGASCASWLACIHCIVCVAAMSGKQRALVNHESWMDSTGAGKVVVQWRRICFIYVNKIWIY